MSFNGLRRQRSRRLQFPLDRLAIGLIVVLVLVAGLLIVLGDHAAAKVQAFSWQDRTVGVDNTAFAMTFTRPMDTDSVEANLQITPALPGRVSWAGRRMAYTLDVPIPYGETYQVTLPEARDRFAEDSDDAQFEAFVGEFRSRDRAMAYIGTEGDEAGRLVLINFSQAGDLTVLTPSDLQVLDFEPYPLGDRILFSAVQRDAAQSDELSPILYTVATGLAPNPPEQALADPDSPVVDAAEAGTVVQVLDNDGYQNLSFDLAPNGQVIVVQRINQDNPADFGPWVIRAGEASQPLATEPGGEFLIGPDSQTLLMLQGQGTAVIPLDAEQLQKSATKAEPLDFLPEFGRVFDLTSDGTAAAMVDFNQNDPERRFTETLVVVTNEGEEQEILDATGSIIAAEFDPTNKILYVLASDLLPSETYAEQPYLAAINLDRKEEPQKLLTFPAQARVGVDIAPDGLAALLEVVIPASGRTKREASQAVLLPLFQTTAQRLNGTPTQTTPQVLPFSGIMPTWLP